MLNPFIIFFPTFALHYNLIMSNRSVLLFFLVGLSLLGGCRYNSKNTVTITGAFPKLSSAKLYFYKLLPGGNSLVDSVTTDTEGNFEYAFDCAEAGYYSLKRNASDGITFVISPGEKITLKGDSDSFNKSYSVTGSKDSELFAQYLRFTNENLHKVDSLSGIFAESQHNADFQSVKSSLDSTYLRIFNDQQEKVSSFINANANSLASLLVISENFGPNPLLTEKTHPQLFLKLDDALMLAYPGNSLVNVFHQRMIDFRAETAEIMAKDSLLKPGMSAPEISLPGTSGKEIALTSLEGKLTLVYFWSSWDARCRQMNLNLSTLYSKYHSQNFSIYAVSLDSDVDLWQNACRIDKAYWVNVMDKKGIASDFSKKYGVKALPNFILIGKDGLIIARNPEFAQLEDLIKKNL